MALFVTCYGDRNEPHMPEDLTAVFQHNGIPVKVVGKEKCCGMPKLELGDLETVEKYKDFNIPQLKALIDEGYDIVAPIPSCVLMFKQELPLMFPEDADVQAVKEHIFDPFEYLMLRHKAGLLRTDFTQQAGQGQLPRALPSARAEHRPQDARRAQAGARDHGGSHRALLRPQRHLRGEEGIPRGLGEDRPAGGERRSQQAGADHYSSDCPMAGHQIESGLRAGMAPQPREPEHPMTLVRKAYGI